MRNCVSGGRSGFDFSTVRRVRAVKVSYSQGRSGRAYRRRGCGEAGTRPEGIPQKGAGAGGGHKFHKTPYPSRTEKTSRAVLSKKEAPVHISKLMLIDPQTDEPTRIRRKRLENGVRIRLAVKSGETDTRRELIERVGWRRGLLEVYNNEIVPAMVFTFRLQETGCRCPGSIRSS